MKLFFISFNFLCNNIEIVAYVLFLRRKEESALQTVAPGLELPALNVHNTQVVHSLNLARFNLQDSVEETNLHLNKSRNQPFIAVFRPVQIFLVVGVDIPEQNQTLDMGGMVFQQLLERLLRLQRPAGVRQQQCQIEEGAAEGGVEGDGLPEAALRLLHSAPVRRQHPQVEVSALVVRLQLRQPLQSLHRHWDEVG